ncbi:putative ion channel protein [Serratia marcescens]|uniref:Putative ion channel protein n=1 Tax=Serratia marcescens TaxID=615 RepID=A0A379YXU2_SERMA|nr:putative ion channel protein [Serratia marcescens]
MDWIILAAAGTIGAMFGTPVAAALIFSQTLAGNNETPLWDRLFAPLVAAAAGAVTTQMFFVPNFALQLDAYDVTRLPDIFSGAIVALIAIALGMGGAVVFPARSPPVPFNEESGVDVRAGRLCAGAAGAVGRRDYPVQGAG